MLFIAQNAAVAPQKKPKLNVRPNRVEISHLSVSEKAQRQDDKFKVYRWLFCSPCKPVNCCNSMKPNTHLACTGVIDIMLIGSTFDAD